MTQLIGFDIYRTETMLIGETTYVVRFTVSKDGQEYILLVSNESDGKQAKYNFSKEVANDYKHYEGKELEAEVEKIIEQDIRAGKI